MRSDPLVPTSHAGIDLGVPRPQSATRGRRAVAIGLGVVASVALLGVALAAGAVVVRTVDAVVFNNSGPPAQSSGSQSLRLQSNLVEQRRAGVIAYAAQLAEYRLTTSSPDRAAGINLDAAEVTRRDFILTGLVLECIDAVDRYNLAAQTRSAAELQSAGVPASFVWVVDCATGQQPAQVENR